MRSVLAAMREIDRDSHEGGEQHAEDGQRHGDRRGKRRPLQQGPQIDRQLADRHGGGHHVAAAERRRYPVHQQSIVAPTQPDVALDALVAADCPADGLAHRCAHLVLARQACRRRRSGRLPIP